MEVLDVLANADLDIVTSKVNDASVNSDCFYKTNVPYYRDCWVRV